MSDLLKMETLSKIMIHGELYELKLQTVAVGKVTEDNYLHIAQLIKGEWIPMWVILN